ncbi:MAG: DUF481 domain-containing protein, partial [Phycisphaeraceae bacterium]|nr:DUF481 domain-containing protein [Phycisphaeraceae bacterium]
MYTPRMVIVFLTLLLSFSMVHADHVVLLNGDKLQGNVISTDQGKVVLQHDVLGLLTLTSGQVISIVKQGDENEQAARQALAPALKTKVALEPLPQEMQLAAESKTWFGRFKKTWDSEFEAGASVKTGNTDNANIYLRFKTTTGNEKRKWDVDAAYYRDQSNSVLTRNEFFASVRHQWLLKNSPWDLFVKGRYDYDDFESWDYRVNSAVGVGYQWIKEDHLDVKLNLGIGAVKEFGSLNDDVRPELLAGVNVKWKITVNQSFAVASTIFPELADLGQYRLLS